MAATGPVVIENCAIATMDGPRYDQSGTEYRHGRPRRADRTAPTGGGSLTQDTAASGRASAAEVA
jgi:hypothetical protein